MNKYFLTLLLTFSLALFTSAQILVKESDGADTRFIPGVYMKSGQAAIYFSSDEYGYRDNQTKYEAEIFDFELKPLKSFYFQVFHPYTVYEERASTGSKELTKIISEKRNIVHGLPSVDNMDVRKTAFISWFYDCNHYSDPSLSLESLTSGCRIEGSNIILTLPFRKDLGNYLYWDYLKTVEVYLDASDEYGYNYIYATVVPIYQGEWSKITWYDVPVSNFCTPKCTDVAGMNHWNGGLYLPFAQTFFNDDEKFEYVRYTAEIVEGFGKDIVTSDNALFKLFGITDSDRDGDGEEDYRSTYFGLKRTGLEVVSEDGSVIYTFPLPETCQENPSIEFFKSDNCILAQVQFNWVDDSGRTLHTVRFYRIDKKSGVTKVINEENHITASPNPVVAGASMRVTIPEGKNNNRSVSITSNNGKPIFTKRIAPDETELSIPTHNFNPGTYVFTLCDSGNIIGNCKIIVR